MRDQMTDPEPEFDLYVLTEINGIIGVNTNSGLVFDWDRDLYYRMPIPHQKFNNFDDEGETDD